MTWVGLEVLKDLVRLSKEEEEGVQLAVQNDIPFGITLYYLSLLHFDSAERTEDY